MKSLNISVTKEDIKKGEAGSFSYCPIALAIKRKVGDKIVSVGKEDVYVHEQAGFDYFSLSKKAKKFIDDFDSYVKVKPAKFRFKGEIHT